MNNQKWKLKEKNGWENWYTWAANLWITGNDEWVYKRFREIANNRGFEEFKEKLNDYIHIGGIGDFEEQDIKPALENIDYKAIYEGLREE